MSRDGHVTCNGKFRAGKEGLKLAEESVAGCDSSKAMNVAQRGDSA